MDFTSIASVFTTAAGGTIFGVVGGFLSKMIELRYQRQIASIELEQSKARYAHDEAMAKADNDARILEADLLLKTKGLEVEATARIADSNALIANYEADRATYATGEKAKDSPWFVAVDVVRGLTRPLLTWFLDIVVFAIVVTLLVMFWDTFNALPADRVFSLVMKIIETILFLASTGTSYWYASRPHAEGQRAG